ncbi:MAG: hypothetical protein M1416_00055 [Candidatus Pacearchaeota archaeon]|nr:hypothetical protein [Candidatus Pacearchaeota archaeon]
MTPIEIIALIAGILIIIKSLIWIAKPKIGLKVAEKFFKNPAVPIITYLILVLIIGFYVFQELTIAQIVAVLLMSSYLIKMVLSAYGKELMPLMRKVYSGTTWQKWFVILVMLIIVGIIGWGLFI